MCDNEDIIAEIRKTTDLEALKRNYELVKKVSTNLNLEKARGKLLPYKRTFLKSLLLQLPEYEKRIQELKK